MKSTDNATKRLPIFLMLLLACSSVLIGCNNKAEQRDVHGLLLVGMQYLEFLSVNKRGPKDLEDFASYSAPMMKNNQSFNHALKRIENGEVVLAYNRVFPEDYSQITSCIIAHEKSAPTSGGLVVDGNGKVHKLTPKEFAKLQMMPMAPEATE